MDYLSEAGEKVEAFLRSSDAFQRSCDAAFDQVDVRGTGRVTAAVAATAVALFFKDVARAVDDFGLEVKQPSVEEIRKILKDNGYTDKDTLDRAQFEDLYVRILKFAAVKAAVGFAQRYGVGMAVGLTAVVILKRAVRSVPVVGSLASPVLRLFPSLLVGPVLGVLGVILAERGDLKDVTRTLFGGDKGQFKSG